MSKRTSSGLRSTFVVVAALIQISAFLPHASYGWGHDGHRSVAFVAHKRLTEKAQNMVVDLLGAESLMVAAIFPDEVRSDPRFKGFAPYHFLEIPVGIKSQNLTPEMRAKKDSDVFITEVPKKLLDRSISKEEKKIFLRYLVHVVGDVHQPLHVGNGVDMGANLCDVKWLDPQTHRIKKSDLHTIMDERVFDWTRVDFLKRKGKQRKGKYYFGYPELVEMAEAAVKRMGIEAKLEEDAKADKFTWYNQSRALHAVIYPDRTRFARPEDRTYCKRVNPTTHRVETGAYDPRTIPTILEPEGRKLQNVALIQVVKGGYRLARLLNDIAEFYPVPDRDTGAHKKLLDAAQIINEHGSH